MYKSAFGVVLSGRSVVRAFPSVAAPVRRQVESWRLSPSETEISMLNLKARAEQQDIKQQAFINGWSNLILLSPSEAPCAKK